MTSGRRQSRSRCGHTSACEKTRHGDRRTGRERGGSRPLSRVLSWTTIPLGALLPVRSSSLPGSGASHAVRFPIWPCFRWGLPCRPCYHVRGELLPRSDLRPTAPTYAETADLRPTAPTRIGAPFHPYLCRSGGPSCQKQCVPLYLRDFVALRRQSPFGHRRSILCCTFRHLTVPGR